MSVQTTITDAIERNPDASPEEIATVVMSMLRKVDLFPLVVAEVEHRYRTIIKQHERSVTINRLGPMLERSGSLSAAFRDTETDNRERLLDLMRRAWKLGDGSVVNIGEATIDEVRTRLEMLRKQHAGLGESIRVLERVEQELAQSGARCLNDLLGVTTV